MRPWDLGDATFNRREVVRDLAALAAIGQLPVAMGSLDRALSRSTAMRITCIIRYQIDPSQRDEFAQYAKNWGHIIPRCGGQLIGYFLPYEGTNDVGWGLIAFESLSAYETYKTRLKGDPEAQENLAMARSKRLILREERNFVEVVEETFERPAALVAPA